MSWSTKHTKLGISVGPRYTQAWCVDHTDTHKLGSLVDLNNIQACWGYNQLVCVCGPQDTPSLVSLGSHRHTSLVVSAGLVCVCGSQDTPSLCMSVDPQITKLGVSVWITYQACVYPSLYVCVGICVIPSLVCLLGLSLVSGHPQACVCLWIHTDYQACVCVGPHRHTQAWILDHTDHKLVLSLDTKDIPSLVVSVWSKTPSLVCVGYYKIAWWVEVQDLGHTPSLCLSVGSTNIPSLLWVEVDHVPSLVVSVWSSHRLTKLVCVCVDHYQIPSLVCICGSTRHTKLVGGYTDKHKLGMLRWLLATHTKLVFVLVQQILPSLVSGSKTPQACVCLCGPTHTKLGLSVDPKTHKLVLYLWIHTDTKLGLSV